MIVPMAQMRWDANMVRWQRKGGLPNWLESLSLGKIWWLKVTEVGWSCFARTCTCTCPQVCVGLKGSNWDFPFSKPSMYIIIHVEGYNGPILECKAI